MKLLILALGLLLGAFSAAAQTDQTAPETKPIAQQAPEKHAPKPEAVAAYQRGLQAYRQEQMPDAARAFESAVALDPEFGLAWKSLGKAKMVLRDYPRAEAAFRKASELLPGDPENPATLAWALNAEKKYDESLALLTRHLANNPDDGYAHEQLGELYMRLRQPDRAIPELEKSASLLPDYGSALYALAEAYFRTHEYDQAAAAYQRAFDVDEKIGQMNDAAFEFAEARTHLDQAETWASRAVEEAEREMNKVELPFDSLALQRANAVAWFWDTLGWVKFRKGDFSGAEKYVVAAAQVLAHPAEFEHLGEICEMARHSNDAADAYAMALALVPANHDLNDDERKARDRLTALLGGGSLEDRVQQARTKMAGRSSVQIPNKSRLVGVLQYAVIIGPGSKLTDIEPLGAADSLAGLRGDLLAASMPQSFPDDTTQKFARIATLTCPREDLPCQFTFLAAGPAMHVKLPHPAPPGEK
jgi:Flp pilus assembly protein TadD